MECYSHNPTYIATSAGEELAVMAMRGGSGVSLPAKALRSATATSTLLVRTIMMSSKMQSNLTEVAPASTASTK
jgi:hypothetical protein